MSNRPIGIDAPGIRDTISVMDADTRKERVIRLGDIGAMNIFPSAADFLHPSQYPVGPIRAANGVDYWNDGRSYYKNPANLRRYSRLSLSVTDALSGRNPFNLGAGIRAMPQFTGVAVFFIDPSLPTNGTGTFANPFNDFPAFSSVVEGAIYCIKAGTVLNRGQYGGLKPDCKIIPYGHGPKPIIRNINADNAAAIFVDATRTGVRLFGLHVESLGTRAIGNLTSIANATNSDMQVIGCTIKMPNASRPSTDVNGIRLQGANNKVIGCIINDIPTDGIWATGDNFEVAYCIINDVSKDGRELGDGIQQDSGNNYHFHHNFIDRSDNTGKATIICGANTSNGIVEYNYLKSHDNRSFSTRNLLQDGTGPLIKRNFILGGSDSLYFAAAADNVIVESNVIINNEFLRSDPNTGNAIKFIKTGGNFTARNNTILSLLKTGINGIVTNSSTGTVRAYNNIIQGFALGLDLQSSSMVENYNCLFNNTNNSLKSLGANSLLVDPRLDENYMPQNPLVHMMGLQYDAGNAATTGAQFDIYGTAFGKSIGAIQADAIDFDEIAGALYWSVNGVKY